MKKAISLILALVLCLSLTACGGSNIEKFCDGGSIMWDGYAAHNNEKTVFYAEFTNGVLTIEEWEYKASSSSPSGKSGKVVDTQTYNYELQGNDTVIIDGTTYTYEIKDNRVIFDKKLAGIESAWKR